MLGNRNTIVSGNLNFCLLIVVIRVSAFMCMKTINESAVSALNLWSFSFSNSGDELRILLKVAEHNRINKS